MISTNALEASWFKKDLFRNIQTMLGQEFLSYFFLLLSELIERRQRQTFIIMGTDLLLAAVC